MIFVLVIVFGKNMYFFINLLNLKWLLLKMMVGVIVYLLNYWKIVGKLL